MLTKNFYNALLCAMYGKKTFYYNYYGTKCDLDSYASEFLRFDSATNVATSKSGQGWRFGTGHDEPTIDDYNISGDVVTTLSMNMSSALAYNDPDGYTLTFVFTLTNTSNSNNVIIGELAYAPYVRGLCPCILHDKLDTIITIPPSGIAQITHTITFKYPSAD